jgi:hypothetical protein
MKKISLILPTFLTFGEKDGQNGKKFLVLPKIISDIFLSFTLELKFELVSQYNL